MEKKEVNKSLIMIIAIILLLGLSFLAGRCSNEGTKEIVPIEVVLPEKTGKSDTIKDIKPFPSKVKDSIIWKDSILITENPFNNKLAQDYIDLEKRYASIDLEKERLKKYLESIQIKEYSIPIENEYILTTNNMTVQGELLSFQQDFKLKERKVDVNVPIKKNLEFFAGAEIGNNLDLDKFVVKGNLMMQNKKGNIVNLSYDTEERIWLGFAFKF